MTEQELKEQELKKLNELKEIYQKLYDGCKKSYEKALKRPDLFDNELIENEKQTFEIAKKLVANIQKRIEQEK